MNPTNAEDPWLNGTPTLDHPRIVDLGPWLDGKWDMPESLRPPRFDWAQRVEVLVALLDELGTPTSFGFDRTKRMLRRGRPDAKHSTEALYAAIKVRRARADGVPSEIPPRPGYRRPAYDQQIKELTPWVNNLKLDRGCIDCGYRAHACALDFDHVRGPKGGNVGAMVRTAGMTHERLHAEIDKCEVVCANCHRIRTFNRRRPA